MGAAPIIVLGMHRSGTTFLTRALRRVGIFMGWRLQEAQEATYFVGLNKFLFAVAGTTWQHPEHFDAVWRHERARRYLLMYLDASTRSPRTASFLGPWKYLRYRGVRDLDFPWGFKDPRTTFTLPFWREVFPDSKVVHIHRHGVDVADSLRRRNERAIDFQYRSFDRARRRGWVYHKTLGFDYLDGADLAHGLALWDQYMNRAHGHVRSLGKAALVLPYEELVHDPVPSMKRILSFVGVDAEVDAGTFEGLDEGKAFGYRKNPELVKFAEASAATLAKWGY